MRAFTMNAGGYISKISSGIGLLASVLFCAMTVQAQSIELQAISDFSSLDSGEVPYYLEVAGNRNAVAINAANPDFREKFARAEHEFLGPDGIYDITINALGEIDGEGEYRLSVNGVIQGVAVNPPVTEDYTVIQHTFPGIALTAPVIIAVESNAVSNDMIPEGDGFAFARGRWRSVELTESTPASTASPMTVDLALSISTVDALKQTGSTMPLIFTLLNQSESTVATNPVLTVALPDELQFDSSDACIPTATGARCVMPELPAMSSANINLYANLVSTGWTSVSASVVADQQESDLNNNASVEAFEILAAASSTTDMTGASTPDEQDQTNGAANGPTTTGSTDNGSANSGSTNDSSTNSGSTDNGTMGSETNTITNTSAESDDMADSGSADSMMLILLLTALVSRRIRPYRLDTSTERAK